MTHITKDNYDITCNIHKDVINISAINNSNDRYYSIQKNISEYEKYTDLGIDIFDIILDSLNSESFTIGENSDILYITILYYKIKLLIECKCIQDDNTDTRKLSVKDTFSLLNKKIKTF